MIFEVCVCVRFMGVGDFCVVFHVSCLKSSLIRESLKGKFDRNYSFFFVLSKAVGGCSETD